MSFQEKLNDLMRQRGLRGRQVSREVGVSDNAVSRWRNGQTYPRSIELLHLARVLGVTMEELIGEE